MGNRRLIIKNTYLVSIGILASRVLGFVREMLVAYVFGTSAVLEAFIVAFRLPNSFRNIFAEGFSDSVATPVLSEYQNNHRRMFALSNHLFSLTIVALFACTVVGILNARFLVALMAPGFLHDAAKFDLAVSFTRITFVYLFLIGLVSNMTAVLYALKKFFIAGANPVLLNLAFIAGVLFFRPLFGDYMLVACVVVAGIAQTIFPFISLRKCGFVFDFKPSRALGDPDIARMGRLFAARLWSSAIYHLNIFVDTIFASLAGVVGLGALASLYYAERIVQFPFGLIANSVSRVALVDLSSLHQENKLEEFKKLLVFSFQNIIFFILPISVGFISIPEAIINVLYVRGAFGEDSARMAACVLFFYGLGLFFLCAAKLFVHAFYALKDAIIPAKIATLCLVLNIALNAALMFPLKIGGVAFATSLASAVNFFLLQRSLRVKIGRIDWQDTKVFFVKVLLLSVAAGLLCRFLWYALSWGRYVRFAAVVASAALLFVSGGYWWGLTQIRYLHRWVLKRK